MKKAFVFALTALIIAMTATGCGNEAKSDISKSTADEASYSSSVVTEARADDQPTTGIEPSGKETTEPTVPTTVKPKTNSNSESSKSNQSSASQTSDHKPAEQVPRHNLTTQIRQALPINLIQAVRVLHLLRKHQTKNLPSATPTRARRGTMRFTKRLTIPPKPKRSRSSIRKHTPTRTRFTAGALSVMCAEQILQKTAKAT